MGLAPYGEPRYASLILDKLLDLREDGSYRLDTAFFGYLDSEAATNAAFEELFGCKRRDPEAPITIDYMDIAASAQAVVEEASRSIASRTADCCSACRTSTISGSSPPRAMPAARSAPRS